MGHPLCRTHILAKAGLCPAVPSYTGPRGLHRSAASDSATERGRRHVAASKGQKHIQTSLQPEHPGTGEQTIDHTVSRQPFLAGGSVAFPSLPSNIKTGKQLRLLTEVQHLAKPSVAAVVIIVH